MRGEEVMREHLYILACLAVLLAPIVLAMAVQA